MSSTLPVHWMKAVNRERGKTNVSTRCGTPITEKDHSEAMARCTAWEADITCQACLLPGGSRGE